MKKSVRNALFYLFFGAFCILAPLIVLYTAGYRFSIKSGIDLDVGSLSITTVPRGTSVTLDNQATRQKTPHVFQELNPGRHTVTLTRAGHVPWQGTISIVPGLTTYIQHVMLFRESTPTIAVGSLSASDLVALHNRTTAYTRTTTQGDKPITTLYLQKTRTENPRFVSEFTDKTPRAIEWSYDGSYLLVQFETDIELYGADGKQLTLNNLNTPNIQRASWDHAQDHILYIETAKEGEIEYTAFDVRRDASLYASNEPILGIVENSVFFIKQLFASSLLSVRQNDQEQELVILPRSTYALVDIRAPYLMLQDAQGDFYFVNPSTGAVVEVSAQESLFHWNNEGDAVVYTDRSEVNLLTLQQQQRDALWRSEQEIRAVAWHPKGQRIIFATNNTVEAIDAYQYALTRNQVTLARFDNIEDFWLEDSGDYLHALGTLGEVRGVYSLRLR